MNALLDNLRNNERLARKLFDIEIEIFSQYDSRSLLERLLAKVEASFQVPMVWLVLVDTQATQLLKRHVERSPVLQQYTLWIDPGAAHRLPSSPIDPLLVNNNIGDYSAWLPPAVHTQDIGSMALAPLQLNGRLAGVLVQADADPDRWNPNMDTFFLAQLAVKTSLCMANLVVREQLEFYATRDSLTGLLNRRELDLALAREVARSQRTQAPVSLLFLDLNDFKWVNDTHGHDAGDAVLQQLSATIEAEVRGIDTAFRYAGDEFVVVLPGVDRSAAGQIAARLSEAVARKPCSHGEAVIQYSISCGIACSHNLKDISVRGLLKAADDALYREKRARQQPTTTPV